MLPPRPVITPRPQDCLEAQTHSRQILDDTPWAVTFHGAQEEGRTTCGATEGTAPHIETTPALLHIEVLLFLVHRTTCQPLCLADLGRQGNEAVGTWLLCGSKECWGPRARPVPPCRVPADTAVPCSLGLWWWAGLRQGENQPQRQDCHLSHGRSGGRPVGLTLIPVPKTFWGSVNRCSSLCRRMNPRP